MRIITPQIRGVLTKGVCEMARMCPYCQKNKDVCGVLNAIDGDVYTARCHCAMCNRVWDEHANTVTGKVVVEFVEFKAFSHYKRRSK